jgi:hypothetical protein
MDRETLEETGGSMTPLKRAKAKVERAAMEWYKQVSRGDIPFNEPREKLLRACAALDKLTKGRNKCRTE